MLGLKPWRRAQRYARQRRNESTRYAATATTTINVLDQMKPGGVRRSVEGWVFAEFGAGDEVSRTTVPVDQLGWL